VKFWKKLRKSALAGGEPAAFSAAADGGGLEGFLREREALCVNAVSRLYSGMIAHAWAAAAPSRGAGAAAVTPADRICGLLLYGKKILFPVFDFPPAAAAEFLQKVMPLPRFLALVVKSDPLHAAQGLAADMDMLEAALGKKGVFPSARYEYELRGLDCQRASFLKEPGGTGGPMGGTGGPPGSLCGPPGLAIRRAEMADAGALFPLQAGYEQEEVLPRGAAFNAESCRRGLERLLAGDMVLAAELEGRFVGKINVNARSLNFFQIGGVYVLPEYRRLGIARAMTAALVREFSALKGRFTLFVKKINAPALRVYESLGFTKTGDYRISYF